jgi:O-antigen/teichoic acid export membrane protein
MPTPAPALVRVDPVTTEPRPRTVDRSDADRDILLAARGGGVKFAGRILATGATFLLQVILTRFLGASDFGRYRLAVLSTELLGRLSGLGLTSTVVRFVPIAARDRDESRLAGILRISFGIPTLVGALAAVGVFFGAGPIATGVFDDAALAPLLRLLSPTIPLFVLLLFGECTTRAFNEIRYSVYGHDLLLSGANIVLAAALLAAGFGLAGAGVAYVLALLVAVLAFACFVHRLFPLRRLWGPAIHPAGEIWRHSVPIYATQLLNAFGGRLETLVLGVFGMTAGVGIYVVALQLSRLGQIFFTSLSTVSLPIVSEIYSRGGAERLRPYFQTVTKWSVMVTLPLFWIIVLFAEPLLSIFGDEFVAGRTGVIVLSLGPLINASTGVSGGIITMTGHARLNSMNALLYLGATIALDLLLIPPFGILGAAVAAVATILLLNLLQLIEVFWLFRILPYNRQFLKPVAASLVGVAAAYLVHQSVALPHALLGAALGAVVLVATYGLVLAGLGFSEEDRLILERVLARVRRREGGG